MTGQNDTLFQALDALGDLLQSKGQSYACVVAGGASLAALGVLDRVTGDVDVLAEMSENAGMVLAPEPLPAFMREAIAAIGRELNLPPAWMNSEMAKGFSSALPPGLSSGITWRSFGALQIGFVGRETLIALKLEAASDDPPRGRSLVHAGDLIALGATDEELLAAARWVQSVNVDDRRAKSIKWVHDHVAARRRR